MSQDHADICSTHNKGISKTKGSGAEAPMHKELPGAGPLARPKNNYTERTSTNEQNQQNP